jgi:restriction endonuclease Mrr
VRQEVRLQEYSYPCDYFAAGPSRVTTEDGVHRCVHCKTSSAAETYTYCENCGSISCEEHTKTERLEGDPVCTGCAVTETFAFSTKYFYDETNREAFRDVYAEMPLHEKAMENPKLVAGVAIIIMGALFGLLVIAGVI